MYRMMNDTSRRFLVVLNAVTDWAIIVCAYLLASWLWLDVWKDTPQNMAFVHNLRNGSGLAACLYGLVLVIVLACFRLYNLSRPQRLLVCFVRVVAANVLGTLGIGAVLYLFRLQEFSRGVLFLFLALNVLFVCAKQQLFRMMITHMFRKGYFHKNVLIIGSGALATQYANDVREANDMRVTLAGCVASADSGSIAPYLGDFSVLERQLMTSAVDEAVIALEADEAERIRPIIALCDKCGTRASLIPFFNDAIPTSPRVETVGRSNLINLRSNRMDNLGFAAFKRAFDILASLTLLIALSPLLLALALLVKLTSPGPIFFRQERVGLNKKPFRMYKFRSMRVNDRQDSAWTTSGDTRVTRFGAFIRKYSLDELPQLYNVLRGDMSLIGPRPELPYFVEKFKEKIPLYMVKHQVRPGMTGWAQVNGYRGDTSIQKRIEHDIWYIEHMSVGLDLKIMFMTAFGGWISRERRGK